jgi:hypothetical protein
MMNTALERTLRLGCILSSIAVLHAGEALLTAKTTKELAETFRLSDGWKVDGDALLGESPEYHSLPETNLEEFPDDAWTYFTVHPVDLWRYAFAGQKDWTDYTVECTVQVEKPAPLKGPRPGATFFNYQWGREAVGSDLAVIVRYQGPDDNYMVRLSSGYGHVELWKTHGGVVRVKPFSFEPKKAYRVSVTAAGRWIVVAIDGKEVVRYCDPVEPILSGQVGFGVRESRVRFSDVQVRRTPETDDPVPQHVPDFRKRNWVGRDTIFDGDEPIGWFGWMPESNRGMDIREVKLVPGLMPLAMPHAGMELYDYSPGGDLQVTAEGKTFGFSVKMGRKDAYEVSSRWEVSYDPKVGYVWDKRVRFLPLQDKVVPTLPRAEDLYFYQLVAPATDKLPKCRLLPNYCLAECQGDRIVAFPNSHSEWNNGLADPSKTVMRPDGCFVSTIDGWGVACQFPADNALRYYSEQCHWGLDAHMRGVGPVPAKGTACDAHVRIFAWEKAKVAEALRRSVRPDPVQPNPGCFRHVEPLNRLDQVLLGMNGESVQLWRGNYQIDRSTGRGDQLCMRIDGGNASAGKGPSVLLGPSSWTGPYLAKRYRFGMQVKADDFRGKVTLLADSFTHPKGRQIPPAKAEIDINGKADWTPVSFEADFPRQVFAWVLRIEVAGEGAVWVDDLEVTPLDGR